MVLLTTYLNGKSATNKAPYTLIEAKNNFNAIIKNNLLGRIFSGCKDFHLVGYLETNSTIEYSFICNTNICAKFTIKEV